MQEREREAEQGQGQEQVRLTQIQFRPGEIAPLLAIRGEREGSGVIARRDLGRYYALLARELGKGMTLFTHNEACLIADVCGSVTWEPAAIPLMWAEIQDAIVNNGLAVRWDVNGALLVQKLQRLSTIQKYALIDAVERFWLLDESDDTERQLRTVGLIR